MGAHEIKGSALSTLRSYLLEARGEAEFAAFLRALPEADRASLRDSLPSLWYPEEFHQRLLKTTFEVLARGDLKKYEAIIAENTVRGMKTFAKLVLSMASASMVLRRTPTLWSVIRRGPATLTVEQSPGVTLLRYRDFPYFEDPLYRHYLRALLGAIVLPTLGRTPEVTLVAYGSDYLDVSLPIG